MVSIAAVIMPPYSAVTSSSFNTASFTCASMSGSRASVWFSSSVYGQHPSNNSKNAGGCDGHRLYIADGGGDESWTVNVLDALLTHFNTVFIKMVASSE